MVTTRNKRREKAKAVNPTRLSKRITEQIAKQCAKQDDIHGFDLDYFSFLSETHPQLLPSHASDDPVQLKARLAQCCGGSNVARRVIKCERFREEINEVANSVDQANAPSKLVSHTQRSRVPVAKESPQQVLPSPPSDHRVQPKVMFPQSTGNSNVAATPPPSEIPRPSTVAKRVKKCEQQAEVVMAVVNSVHAPNIPAELASHNQNSPSSKFSALPTVPTSVVKELPRQVKVYSRAYPLQHATPVPCFCDESTAQIGLFKKCSHGGKFACGTSTRTPPIGDIIQDANHAATAQIGAKGSVVSAKTTNDYGNTSLEEAPRASDVMEDRPETSTERQTTSVNLTEMAQQLDNDCLSFSSGARDDLVIVDGYRIKKDLAPILKDIFSRYGDISAKCCKESVVFRSFLLEKVCEVVQKLRNADFVHFPTMEINGFRELLRDIQLDGVELKWLLIRLDEIHVAKQLLKESLQVKQARSKACADAESVRKEMKAREEEMRKSQEKINSLKDQLRVVREEEKKLDIIISHTKAVVKGFHGGSMIDGLL